MTTENIELPKNTNSISCKLKNLIAAGVVLGGILIIGTRAYLGGQNGEDVKEKQYKLNRPAEWAVGIEKEGLLNFHKVSDDLYRGAQPTAEGIKQLKEMGIKTIVNLRSFNSDKGEIGNTEIGYEHIYMKAWHPEEKEIAIFLKTVTDKTKTPVFVHCQHGADRTGLMCAIYRVAVCGWSKQAAADEMIYGGGGFYLVW